jgi:hypothetical protein
MAAEDWGVEVEDVVDVNAVTIDVLNVVVVSIGSRQ